MDVRHAIDQGRITSLQTLVLGLCFFANMLDGMDVLAISLAAPVLSREWEIPAQMLGSVFSSALIGMALGSIFLAPLADVIGRRKLIMMCLAIISVGMIATASANTIRELLTLRFVTGVGVGGILASMATMSAEFSPERRRNLLVAFVQAGYPVGAAVLGIIVVEGSLIPSFGWPSVFLLAGILTAITLPVVALYLPESLEFLLKKQPAGALEAVNDMLRRMGHDEIDELPPLEQADGPEGRTATLLSRVGTETHHHGLAAPGRTRHVGVRGLRLTAVDHDGHRVHRLYDGRWVHRHLRRGRAGLSNAHPQHRSRLGHRRGARRCRRRPDFRRLTGRQRILNGGSFRVFALPLLAAVVAVFFMQAKELLPPHRTL